MSATQPSSNFEKPTDNEQPAGRHRSQRDIAIVIRQRNVENHLVGMSGGELDDGRRQLQRPSFSSREALAWTCRTTYVPAATVRPEVQHETDGNEHYISHHSSRIFRSGDFVIHRPPGFGRGDPLYFAQPDLSFTRTVFGPSGD